LGFARFTVCVLEFYFMPLAHHESATGGDGGGSDGGTVRVDDGMLARVRVTRVRDWV
jgi:hypothetical protein